MESLSFLEAFAKSTHETTSYVPLDNDGNCPYCINPSYIKKEKGSALDGLLPKPNLRT